MVVTTVLVVASSVAVWAHRTVFDTDQFMATVGPTLDDPAFDAALADDITEQTLEALDLDTRVSRRLAELDEVVALALVERLDVEPGPLLEALGSRVDRPTLAVLTPMVVESLEGRVETVVHRLVTSEAFGARLPRLVERAHSAVTGLARADVDDYPDVYLTEDAVMLNTVPLVVEALRESLSGLADVVPDVTLPEAVAERAPEVRAQLEEALGARLPADLGQVVLMDREMFDLVQTSVVTVDRAVWLLLALTVVLVVATLLVAPDRRRGAIQLGLGVVAGLVISVALVGRLRDLVVDVARTPDGERVAEVLFDAVAGGLHEIAWLVGVLAAVTAVVGTLLGRPARPARAGERWPWLRATTGQDGRPAQLVAHHADALRVVVVATAVVTVVATGFSWVALVLVTLLGTVCLVGISVAQRTADVPGRRQR
ncbi:hypothetical protein GCM10009718_36400 [Isoptericola halotolerans]